ncbi:MAG: hypothetical protein HQL94_00610 [Magnetococcales bacterium]|nr:hypothetical protein [Magnetococcales bacterium]
MSMQLAEGNHRQYSTMHWLLGLGLCLLLVLTGCSDTSNDPVTLSLTAQDTTLETLERIFRSESYWTKKVAVLEKQLTQARELFEERNQAYHKGLLSRREAALKAVQEARTQKRDTKAAQQEAIQAHRSDLNHLRDEARDAGRAFRGQLAMFRKAQDHLDKSR